MASLITLLEKCSKIYAVEKCEISLIPYKYVIRPTPCLYSHTLKGRLHKEFTCFQSFHFAKKTQKRKSYASCPRGKFDNSTAPCEVNAGTYPKIEGCGREHKFLKKHDREREGGICE